MLNQALWLFLIVLTATNITLASDVNSGRASGVTFRVLHNFTGGEDGCEIYAGLARDGRGNLYGVAGGNNCFSGSGDLFELTNTRRGFKFHVLHNFSSEDGWQCLTAPVIDKSGNIFGTCQFGPGWSSFDGTFWEYSRTGKFTVLHAFDGPGDGSNPGGLMFDGQGVIYGVAGNYGPSEYGTLWKYAVKTGTFTTLHDFGDGDGDGENPSGPRMDKSGVLWGIASYGPNCYVCGPGTLWNYDVASGAYNSLLVFNTEGIFRPVSDLAIGEQGNFFGVALSEDCSSCEVIYELEKDNGYAPVALFEFSSKSDGETVNQMRFNHRGAFMGTTGFGGPYGYGVVYELVKQNGVWQEILLHSFVGSDGDQLASGLVTDRKGNWFGTATWGGAYGYGTVFEISGVK